MEKGTTQARKRKLSLIAGLFTGLLLVLTFAGNTIQNLTLPHVVTAVITKGSLDHSYSSRSTVHPKEVRELVNPSGWKVEKVLVTKGETVRKGQILVQYDGSEVKQQLAVEQSALKKLELSIELLEYNIMHAMQEEDEALRISASTAFETAKIDIAAQAQHIENLKHTLSVNQQMEAPFDGIVVEVGAMDGLNSTGAPDITMTNLAKGYGLELSIPLQIASMFDVGDVLDHIMLDDKEERRITGEIERIAEGINSPLANADDAAENSTSTMSRMWIKLEEEGLTGGEQVNVNLTTTSTDQFLIPNQAVHKDSEGAYVFTLNESQGPLGNTYYAVRTPIQISDSNDHRTAVSEGLFDQQEIVVDSSGLIIDGTRVNMYNQF
ncbi:hypothetical protein AWU65_22460 [Paenibacillus glucanolyticus]|uniref:Uncharacterized protein n=1 Tax=Paenibacillus glucanolyticus TaxID=59843 RepID=A0A163LVB9_9BACL|nr:biotin/lipoyl-binding protein [Paenibacillus glucanolyticus]KZS48500.1 hypothetical protein AWU65_22460 [Paenibacillus glucanolyticus]